MVWASDRSDFLVKRGLVSCTRPVPHRHATEREVILPLMRCCFFGGALHAVFLLHKGHGDQLASDIASFIMEEPRSKLPKSYSCGLEPG